MKSVAITLFTVLQMKKEHSSQVGHLSVLGLIPALQKTTKLLKRRKEKKKEKFFFRIILFPFKRMIQLRRQLLIVLAFKKKKNYLESIPSQYSLLNALFLL